MEELPGRVDAIETHMSWVFLTDRFAYKLKKPIRYDRLDFTTLRLRRFYCEEEVRLNRRLAANVYEGTVALNQDATGALVLGDSGTPVDWLVHMDRLPEERSLEYILARSAVQKEDLRTVALRLADFYVHARRVPITSQELRTRLRQGVIADQRKLLLPEFGLARERVEATASSLLEFLERHPETFEARVRDGRIVEGHGDLRPEHIYLTPEPAIVDCLEFCSELRELDPADELAFLMLECERLGQPRVGEWFRDLYEEHTGDVLPEPLLDFYRQYRALRRAKIAAWHLQEPMAREQERFLAKAQRYLELARPTQEPSDSVR